MTVANTNSRVDYIANGSTDTFDYTFQIFNDSDLNVVTADTAGVETLLVLNTDYTVDRASEETDGGTITLTAGNLTSGYTITIRRVLPLTQDTDIRNHGTYFPADIEDGLDYSREVDQQLQEQVDRSIKIPVSEDPDDFDLTLPIADDRAGKALVFDNDGKVTVSNAVLPSEAAVSAFMETVLDDTTAGAARTTLGDPHQTVTTIAALKALSGANLTGVVLVQYYTTLGDEGGGIFVWDGASSATGNNGTIITPNVGGTGRWKRLVSGHSALSVKWFGATGDNSTNDATAIQACLDAASADKNRPVYFPEGRYVCTSQLTVSTGLLCFGPGSMSDIDTFGASVIFDTNSSGFNFTSTGAANSSKGGGIRDLAILKATGRTGSQGILVTGVDATHNPQDLTFFNVLVSARGTGVWSRGIFIDGSVVVGGISYISMHKIRVMNCSVANEYIRLRDCMYVSGSGIRVEQGANGTATVGMMISGDCQRVSLNVEVDGNFDVNVGATGTHLVLTGRIGTLLQNSTTATGFAMVSNTGATNVNASADFRILQRYAEGDPAYIQVEDVKASGTNGGTSVAATWNVRVLNTEVTDSRAMSAVASNRVTLQPGLYEYDIYAPAFRVDEHRLRLYNFTDSTVVKVGQSAYSANGDTVVTMARVTGRFTITAAKAFEVHHYTTTAHVNTGLGVPSSIASVDEVYTVAIFRRISPTA